MAKLTRRSFMSRATVGAAAIGVAAGALGATVGSDVVESLSKPAALTNPLMLYVTDASSGEVTYLIGAQSITRRDPALIARLIRAVS